MAAHPLRPSSAAPPAAPAWPSFRGKASLVGTSQAGTTTVYVDASLGAPVQQNGQALLADADRVTALNDKIFGITGAPVSVVIFALGGATDGTGGADHGGCSFTNGGAIEVCADFGAPARISALFEAELSECAMNGNLCGESTGEALSRWCAAVVSTNALADFATAPQWDAQGRPDFVTTTDPTDQNAVSTGCGMAFLSWLLSQAPGLPALAQAMVKLGDSGTLADLYAVRTGQPAGSAWTAFTTALASLGGPIADDDPFQAFGATVQALAG